VTSPWAARDSWQSESQWWSVVEAVGNTDLVVGLMSEHQAGGSDRSNSSGRFLERAVFAINLR